MKVLFLCLLTGFVSFFAGRYSVNPNHAVAIEEEVEVSLGDELVESEVEDYAVSDLEVIKKVEDSVVKNSADVSKKKEAYERKKRGKEVLQKAYDLMSNGPDDNMVLVTELFKEAREYLGDTQEVLSNLSNNLLMQGELKEALKVTKECVANFPKDNLCNGNLINIEFDNPDISKLEESIETCLENTPKNSMCHMGQASYFMKVGKHKEAIDKYESLLNQESSQIKIQNKFIYDALSFAYRNNGNEKIYLSYTQKSCDSGNKRACDRL